MNTFLSAYKTLLCDELLAERYFARITFPLPDSCGHRGADGDDNKRRYLAILIADDDR